MSNFGQSSAGQSGGIPLGYSQTMGGCRGDHSIAVLLKLRYRRPIKGTLLSHWIWRGTVNRGTIEINKSDAIQYQIWPWRYKLGINPTKLPTIKSQVSAVGMSGGNDSANTSRCQLYDFPKSTVLSPMGLLLYASCGFHLALIQDSTQLPRSGQCAW